MAHYKLFFDGSCGPKNPGGTAAYGYALFIEGQEEPVTHGSGVIGTGDGMTNNLAEFYALCEGLKAYEAHFGVEQRHTLAVYGDSNLVIQIMTEHWRPKNDKAYYPAFFAASERVRGIRRAGTTMTFDWVPRKLNQVCDDLSKAHQKKAA